MDLVVLNYLLGGKRQMGENHSLEATSNAQILPYLYKPIPINLELDSLCGFYRPVASRDACGGGL